VRRDDVSALVLAGGKATRLGGADKRELVVGGQTIFQRQCAVLGSRVAEILVSSARPVPGYRTVPDAVADVGPLAGIAAGLGVASTPWLLVIAGDMPYITGAWIDLIRDRIANDCDAVGIRIGGLPEPLFCALRVAACEPIVTRRLATRAFKAAGLLEDASLRVNWIEEAAARAIDPELRGLHNVNAPEDLARP
jgi:molybdenum cofactor guanylyltransferase